MKLEASVKFRQGPVTWLGTGNVVGSLCGGIVRLSQLLGLLPWLGSGDVKKNFFFPYRHQPQEQDQQRVLLSGLLYNRYD